jgi:hypothetical protein
MTGSLSRRSFLRGVVTVGVVIAALPRVVLPQLWGDMIHDDTDGLQALMDRKPVEIIHDGAKILPNGRLWINGGKFRVTRPVTLRSYTDLTNSIFYGDYPEPILIANGDCEHCFITDCAFDNYSMIGFAPAWKSHVI